MSSLLGSIFRALVLIWVVDAMLGATDPDYKAKRLRERIDLARKWNQRLGEHIIDMEKEYGELVS